MAPHPKEIEKLLALINTFLEEMSSRRQRGKFNARHRRVQVAA